MNNIVKNLSDWSKLPPRILFALTLVCGVFLFARTSFFKTLGLDEIQVHYRAYFGIGFLLFGILLISFPVAEGFRRIYKWLEGKYDQKKRFNVIKEWLNKLTPEQKKILRTYIEKDTRSQRLDYKNGAVNELMNAGILYLPTKITLFETYPLGGDGWYIDYNIKPKVYSYLRDHLELLS